MDVNTILTLPESSSAPLSIRAKALVFHDPGSLSLLDHVERLASSDATILVTGETGTGKELIARHIHATSGRRGPFVAVNCGAFSETLIDAELFGHESGAFTGATHARAGWFETANGGTLFLDEIGDLPLALQVKLLRVLQERQVTRLGSRRSVTLDVRLIAATNIDLAHAVEAQHFRADLYYRLSVAGVRLPPLRERRADILPLARHFVSVYRGKLDLEPISLSPSAAEALLDYSWPGNIRELENVIHYALIVCRDQVIQRQDLRLVPLVSTPVRPGSAPSDTLPGIGGWTGHAPAPQPDGAAHAAQPTATEPAPVSAAAEEPAAPLSALARLPDVFRELLHEGGPELFDAIEDALIRTAFEHCKQNQVRTAKALGITRNMLRTQLKRHGLLNGEAGTEPSGADDDALAPPQEPEPETDSPIFLAA